MPILRLAYATQFLIALIAVFVLWSQVGGQSHLDLMPWYLKLGLGAGAAFAAVKASAAAVSHAHAWNGATLKWFGITLALLIGCGLASYYYHVYGETDEDDEQDTQTSSLTVPLHGPLPHIRHCRIMKFSATPDTDYGLREISREIPVGGTTRRDGASARGSARGIPGNAGNRRVPKGPLGEAGKGEERRVAGDLFLCAAA